MSIFFFIPTINGGAFYGVKCHPEQGEGSLTCPPHNYGRQGFFTEFTLSQKARPFASLRVTQGEGLRMTRDEGFRMTFVILSLNLLLPHYSNIPSFHRSNLLLLQ
jgi:hypothetical protein